MDAPTLARLAALGFTPEGPLSTPKVRALERALECEFPADYAAFLLATGGGDFSESILCRCEHPPPIAGGGGADLGQLFGASGDYYCLRRRGSRVDVAYFDHDSGETYDIAESFTDLIARLEVDTEPVDTSGVVGVWIDPDLL